MKPVEVLAPKRALQLAVPRTWGDCINAERHTNCDVARCRYNLRYEFRYGKFVKTRAVESCALAVAEEGEHSDKQVAAVMGVTRQRVEQITMKALVKLHDNEIMKDLADAR